VIEHFVLEDDGADLVFYGFGEAFSAKSLAAVDSVKKGFFAFAFSAFASGSVQCGFTLDNS
jgi:hypothetical protein